MKNKSWKFSDARKANLVHITYERDYDHEAWSVGDAPEPTVQTCPDAFYKISTPAYPALSEYKKESRKTLVDRLSHTALRKRLSRLGLRGAELQRVQQEFWTPKLSFESDGYGLMFMHWNVKDLKKHFGRRISHAILNHVRTIFVFLDEFAYYAAPGLVEMMQGARSLNHVKFNAKQIVVTQSQEDFPSLCLG